eukprot:TRINITY_DN2372_c1_g1_i1.p1 TRINITY_DN2372_c1_g1~~TRINITY_DN2372_c1_g1_i1.p1  ORF type:complete len:307 (-),score=51.74 TRINITY_DN2372_c1_g1_i1:164-1084(-)
MRAAVAQTLGEKRWRWLLVALKLRAVHAPFAGAEVMRPAPFAAQSVGACDGDVGLRGYYSGDVAVSGADVLLESFCCAASRAEFLFSTLSPLRAPLSTESAAHVAVVGSQVQQYVMRASLGSPQLIGSALSWNWYACLYVAAASILVGYVTQDSMTKWASFPPALVGRFWRSSSHIWATEPRREPEQRQSSRGAAVGAPVLRRLWQRRRLYLHWADARWEKTPPLSERLAALMHHKRATTLQLRRRVGGVCGLYDFHTVRGTDFLWKAELADRFSLDVRQHLKSHLDARFATADQPRHGYLSAVRE